MKIYRRNLPPQTNKVKNNTDHGENVGVRTADVAGRGK